MAHVTEKNVGPQTSKSHDCITCIFLTEKNIFEKNKVYCRTTITNVHPKRPWMCFSDKHYRRKVHAKNTSENLESATYEPLGI